jgi:hypothetical protein
MDLPRILKRQELDVLLRSPMHREIPGAVIVLRSDLSGDGRLNIRAVEWPTGPKGAVLIARCQNGCHWIARLPETVRQRGQEIADAIPQLDGMLRRMRLRANRRGCR